jgi:membrane associated rhomboid family serine protease
MMVGYSCENNLRNKDGRGWLRMLTILIVGGTIGNMLSTVLSPYTLGVGASSSVFAVLGVICVWTALNYQNFGGQKGRVVILLLILNGITLLASFF